jgi:polysaccharide pyruvyl transferase WcaK-like protein
VYQVCLLGASLEGGNRGVNALAASLVGLAAAGHPNLKVSFVGGGRISKTVDLLVGERTLPVHVVCYRFSPRAPLKDQIVWNLVLGLLYALLPFAPIRRGLAKRTPMLETLHSADFVGDIRGGDSFSDIYGNRLLVTGSLPYWVAFLLGKRIVLLPQTYGPFKSGFARWFARLTLRKAKARLARDLESQKVAVDLLGAPDPESGVPFSPDVAFTLEARRPERVDFQPPLPQGNEPLRVGLNVSGLLGRRSSAGENPFGFELDYNEFVERLGSAFLENTNCRLLLVPHVFPPSPQGDFPSCERLKEKLVASFPNRIHLLHGTYDQNEIKGVIGDCDFFMGSRMHACIAAVSQGIPTIGLAYSRKFRGVFESAGVGDMVVDLTEKTADEAVSACLDLFARREEAARELSTRIPKVQELVRERVGGLFVR